MGENEAIRTMGVSVLHACLYQCKHKDVHMHV